MVDNAAYRAQAIELSRFEKRRNEKQISWTTKTTRPSRQKALHPDAELTLEASIGKIANDQLVKLMSLGLSNDEAVNRIIEEFLK